MDLPDLRVTYMNQLARIALGYDEDDIEAGLTADRFVDADEQQRLTGLLMQLAGSSLEFGTPYERTTTPDLMYFDVYRKDGSRFPVESQASFVLDAAGIPTAIRIIVRDLTTRLAIEEREAGTASQLRRVAENAPVLLVEVDRARQVILCEGEALERVGLRAVDVVGQPSGWLARRNPELGALIERGLAGETVAARIAIMSTPFDVRVRPLVDERGAPGGCLLVAIVATEQGEHHVPRSGARCVPERGETSPGHHPVVLVVDDDPLVRRTTGLMLTRLGYRPVLAASGHEAIDHLATESVDAIILDLVMPGMTGSEVYRRISAEGWTIPVIVCTGFAGGDYLDDALREAMAAFLPKPFTGEDLVRVLSRVAAAPRAA
jgi:PAS domain S-box-containing protein